MFGGELFVGGKKVKAENKRKKGFVVVVVVVVVAVVGKEGYCQNVPVAVVAVEVVGIAAIEIVVVVE